MSKTTARPWRVDPLSDQCSPLILGPNNAPVIAVHLPTYDEEGWWIVSDEDAELIVRAVNAHDELVRLVENMRACLRRDMSKADAKRIADVLALARGEQERADGGETGGLLRETELTSAIEAFGRKIKGSGDE